MTATHFCDHCKKKTTHVPGLVGDGGPDSVTVLRCVVCGTVVPISIKED